MDVINNIDGSIYIVDHNNSNVWEKDFNLQEKNLSNEFDLKIDHIAQTLHQDEMSSALLSYTTLFGTKK